MLKFAEWLLEVFDYENHPNVPHLIQTRLDRSGGYKVVVVDVDKFDKAWSKDREMYLPPGGNGSNYIPIHGMRDKPEGYNRYHRVGEEAPKFKEKGMPFEMSTIGSVRSGVPLFVDGRHRFAYFRDQGIKFLPMSVSPEAYPQFISSLGVKNI